MKPQDKVLVILGSAAIIATAGFGGYALFTGGNTAKTTAATPTQSVANSTPTTTRPTTATPAATSYADGTYTASVSYFVPDDGQNSLKATVTISNGAIGAVTTDSTYGDRKSRQYVDGFERGISSATAGQSVAHFSVGRVGGASLTSSAFNDALDTIRNEAKA